MSSNAAEFTTLDVACSALDVVCSVLNVAYSALDVVCSAINVACSAINVANSAIDVDNVGQVIQVITNPNETIDVSGLLSGSYFIRITSHKGSVSGKFIKE